MVKNSANWLRFDRVITKFPSPAFLRHSVTFGVQYPEEIRYQKINNLPSSYE